jgi:excisionase family DNA binding protein
MNADDEVLARLESAVERKAALRDDTQPDSDGAPGDESDKKPAAKKYPADALALPVEEIARRLSLSPSFVWKLIRQNDIAAIRLGRRTLVPASEIARLMETAA